MGDLHTEKKINSTAQFAQLAALSVGKLTSVKFIITDFHSPNLRQTRYLDGKFYSFHDEWYWFHLLNGKSVLDAMPIESSSGYDTDTPQACVTWVKAQRDMPRGLRFSQDRLYADRFYRIAIGQERQIGLGAIIHQPAVDAKDSVWGFQLEYADTPSTSDIEVFLLMLRQSVSSKIAQKLVWVTRSPFQEKLGKQMIQAGQLHSKEVMAYADLAVDGDAEIYHPGIAVGSLMLVHSAQEALAQSDANKILVVEQLPDDLPAAAGLISAIPQTPLSHLNILARNRGIPSAYIGGVQANPYVIQLAHAQAKVVLKVSDGEIHIAPLTDKEYERFQSHHHSALKTVQTPQNHSIPYTIPLSSIPLDFLDSYRPYIGGKASGIVLLHHVAANQIPAPSMIITTRAFREQMAQLTPMLESVLANRTFIQFVKARYFVLEGKRAFDKVFGTMSDKEFEQAFAQSDPDLYAIGKEGGVKSKIRKMKLDPQFLKRLMFEITQVYEDFSTSQGLRFRSSSTVEDVEGFNGAGLYVSSTGFLQSTGLPKKQHKKTIAWAIKKTWASYWNWHAYQERESFGIDHLSGAMAILVHPRFDDALERANGVVTFTINKSNGAQSARMEVNTQVGSLSVTNPPSHKNALPETCNLSWEDSSSQLKITRVAASTQVGLGQHVLSDPELEQLFNVCHLVSEKWLQTENDALSQAHKRQMITLDFEFRKMDKDWLGHSNSRLDKEAIVVKQVRTLESPPLIEDIESLALPLPRELMLQATLVRRKTCMDKKGQYSFLEVFTTKDTSLPLGYHQFPYIADLSVVHLGKIENIEPQDFGQPIGEEYINLAPDIGKRLGRAQLPVVPESCLVKVIAMSKAIMLQDIFERAKCLGKIVH